MSNPYYEEKLKNLNSMLQKVQDDNSELEKENEEIKVSLEELENEIKENYDSILKKIEPLKVKN